MSAQNVFVIRLSTGRNIQLREGMKLTAEEIGGLGSSMAGNTVAEVNHNPNEPTILGLKNLTHQAWSATVSDGGQRRIDPGKSLRLAPGTKIKFGTVEGLIQLYDPASSRDQPAAGSIQGSLERLGIPVTRPQLVGFVLSVVIGLVVARLLPYIYPFISPIYKPIFDVMGVAPDGFNWFSMTVLTFFASYLVSFYISWRSRVS